MTARVYRLERAAGRDFRERLRIMRQRVGILYFDGLPSTTNKNLVRLFDMGLRHATLGHWERAFESWAEGRKTAAGSEALALGFLCACCQMMGGRVEQAKTNLASVLNEARRAGDRPAAASCRFVMGRLEQEAKRYAAALAEYRASAGLWQELDDSESEAFALAEAAESAEAISAWEDALDLHRAALRLAEQSGNHVGASSQYGAVGAILSRLGDLDKARAAHEDGLHLARQAGDRTGEAERLSAIGDIHLAQGSPKRALDAFDRALRSYREAGSTAGEARTLAAIAAAHRQLGEQDVALEHFEHALRLGRRLGDRRLVARSLEGVAEGVAAHGDLNRAQSLLETAVGLDRETGDEAGLACRLHSMGRVLLDRHENAKAVAVLTEAIEVSRRISDAALELSVAVLLARAHREQGRPGEALKLLEHRQDEAAAGLKEAAFWHIEVGLCHAALGEAAKAVAELRQAVESQRAEGGRGFGVALVSLGVTVVGSGDKDAGMRSIEDGLRELHKTGNRPDEAWALRSLAEANLAGGNPAAARGNLERALELARDTKDGSAEADSLVLLGRTAAGEGDSEQARAYLEQAARIYSRDGLVEKSKAANEELRRLPRSGAGVRFLDG